MKFVFILYMFCVGAAMQEVSNRLSAAYHTASQTLNKHLGCLDKAYRKIKQEARSAIGRVVGRFRGGDVEKVENEGERALLGTEADEKVENFKKKLQEIIDAMKEKQQSQDGGSNRESESMQGYEMSEDFTEDASSEQGGEEKVL